MSHQPIAHHSEVNAQHLYDRNYYLNYHSSNGIHPYERSAVWQQFFDSVANRMVADFAPTTVLDAGCAIGMLVESLRNNGVEAVGFDISDYAITQVPLPLQPYILNASILDPAAVRHHYDIAVCIEVVEHLYPEEGDLAIANLCQWSDLVLFSSSPEDFTTPTHINVQPTGYWAERFARHGFLRMLEYDGNYIAPWAMLFRRQTPVWAATVHQYEAALWQRQTEATRLRHLLEALRQKYNASTHDYEAQLTVQVAKVDALASELSNLELSYLQQLIAQQQRHDIELGTLHTTLADDRNRAGRDRQAAQANLADLQIRLQLMAEELSAAELAMQERQHQLISVQDKALHAQSHAQQLNLQVRQLEEQLATTQENLLDHGQGLAEALRQLTIERAWGASVRATLAWRAMHGLWQFRQWLFPPSSSRERTYFLLRTSAEILLQHGPAALLDRLSRWLRGERRYFPIRNSAASIDIEATTVLPSTTAAISSPADEIRVAYVTTGLDIASKRYRVHNIAEQLACCGIAMIHVSEVEVLSHLTELMTFAVIVFARVTLSPTTRVVIDHARRHNIPCCFEIDDFVFDTAMLPYIDATKHLSPNELQQYVHGMEGYRQMLQECHYFIGSTEYLAEQARELYRRTFVIRNGLSARQVQLAEQALQRGRRTQDGLIRIGYLSGSRTHQQDFAIAAPALSRILAEFPKVRLVIRGFLDIPVSLQPYRHQIETAPFIHWEQLLLSTIELDISIAPLECDNPFTQAKSALKYFEAALLEVPTIATPIEDFRHAITHNWNGLLADNDAEWYHCLHSLVTTASLRQRLGNQARQHTLSQYTPTAMCAHTRDVFFDIVNDHHRTARSAAAD